MSSVPMLEVNLHLFVPVLEIVDCLFVIWVLGLCRLLMNGSPLFD